MPETNAGSEPADCVDLASEESFPASDPPPWTSGEEERPSRIEHDFLGPVRVPRDALYGAQTQRARENFDVGPYSLQPELIRALGLVKACAARTNAELGELSPELGKAIEQAAAGIAAGAHYDQFVVNVFQTGSGTSTNMNANEVIAKLAGAHANDHVNRGQSSNDVFPSAMHVAAAVQITERLLPSMALLRGAFAAKATEFQDVVKMGRTHLNDAVPLTLGQEFSGYTHQVAASIERIESTLMGLYELPLGGTAVGTGINAAPGFAARTILMIRERTGLPFCEARNHFEAQAARDAVLFVSGALKTYAAALTKIANDLRWMGSGPRAGLAEIRLPELQPGSSIMPGKVNPVIPESVLMACAQVFGHDAAITCCCASGNFELNTMMPLIAYDLLDSIALLASVSRNFAERCVSGIEAARERAAACVEQSPGLAAFLVPVVGYEQAAAIARQALDSGTSVRETAILRSGLSVEKINELLRNSAP